MTLLDRAAGLALAIAALGATMWLSNAPITVHASPEAMLRLAWSALPERVERCRQRSESELAALPPHMRQPFACEGTSAQYRLAVTIQGAGSWEQTVQGGGLRHDRRLYVMRELVMPAGEVLIDVRFDRVDGSGVQPASPGDTRNGRPGAETIPAHLELRQRLHVPPRAVVLVTYSPEQRALVTIRSPGSAQ